MQLRARLAPGRHEQEPRQEREGEKRGQAAAQVSPARGHIIDNESDTQDKKQSPGNHI